MPLYLSLFFFLFFYQLSPGMLWIGVYDSIFQFLGAWIGVYDSIFQFLPISSNFTQPLKRSGQPDQLYVKERWCTAWGKWWSHHILAGFRTPPSPQTPQYSKTAHFRVAFYCGQPKAHLCNNHACCLISILICHTCEVDGLYRQRRSAH